MNNWKNTNYLSLSTRKKDGTRVETPVWFAQEDNDFYLFSEGKAGKVKRIRNFPDVKICPCGITGKLQGNWEDATAVVLQHEEDKQVAYQTLLNKYGWQLRLLDFGATIAGKRSKRAFIQVTLSSG